MTIELKMLVWSIILGFAQILGAGAAITKVRGSKWNMGARDEILPPPTGVPGRLDRAAQNFKETFPFFLAAVFLVQTCNTHSAMTALGAHLYFFSRLIYVPLYTLGIPVARTIVWMISVVGIVLLLCSLA
jgi:uncharacterized MAPEG superfamily protein